LTSRTSTTITAVVPVRNGGEALSDALDSVNAQSRVPDETIVVDDGSTDGSGAIAAASPSKPAVLRLEGKGVAAARNAALAAATSDWIAFLDADDAWAPGHLERVERRLQTRPDAVAVFAGALHVDEQGRVAARASPPEGEISLSDLARGRVVPTTSATVVARSTAIEVGGFDEDFQCASGVEDLDLWLRLAAAGRCLGIGDPGATYVVHDARDAVRSREYLTRLANDRERAVERLESRHGRGALVRSASAVMRSRTARYWLRAGYRPEARRAALASLRTRLTAEGAAAFAASLAPVWAIERSRRLRRAWRGR
jgi:glycosyltransferase involved in cell wall biosynthesis